MRNLFYTITLLVIFSLSNLFAQTAIVAVHNSAKLSIIPANWIDSAKAKLHIAYGHTSHGSQLITGMEGLQNWKGSQYAFNEGGTNGALDIDDYAFSGASDLGNPNRTAWANATRNYLNNSVHGDVNVVIWSWCGQVSDATIDNINTYLNLMNELENDYPNVKFVYMTGHLDGTGVNGNLNQRNEQIRNYCTANNKILFDFADIESYDPDGNYYLNKSANDNCDYDSDGNGSLDKNWATDWQNSHTLNVDWFNCSAAHSQPLNGNLKAYAAWWLWARLAGWNSVSNHENENQTINSFELYQNYPNPFNPSTTLSWQSPVNGWHTLKIYNLLGEEIETLVSDYLEVGFHSVPYNVNAALPSGIYFCQLSVRNTTDKSGDFISTMKMILLR